MKKYKGVVSATNAIDRATTTSKNWGHVVAGKGGKTLNADIPVKTPQKAAESLTDYSEHAAAGLVAD